MKIWAIDLLCRDVNKGTVYDVSDESARCGVIDAGDSVDVLRPTGAHA